MKKEGDKIPGVIIMILIAGYSFAREIKNIRGPYTSRLDRLPEVILTEPTDPLTLLPLTLKPDLTNDLHRAAGKGDIRRAKKLLRRGISINSRDNDGMTPLHYAVGWGRVTFSGFLIKRGADVNASNLYGSTPLFFASDLGMVKLILKAGSKVNRKNDWGETPLFWAAEKGYADIVRTLIDHGADVKVFNINLETPLHRAAHYFKGPSHLEIINLLLDHGADVNAGNLLGWTPLHWAVKKGKYRAASLLVKRGAGVNLLTTKNNGSFRISSGSTPLHVAIKEYEDNIGIVSLLLRSGADVLIRDSDGLDSYDLARKEALTPETEWYGTAEYKRKKRAGLKVIIGVLGKHLKNKKQVK